MRARDSYCSIERSIKGPSQREDGTTETCGIISIDNTMEERPLSGANGTLVPGVESKIISVKMVEPLLLNHTGESWLRGPSIVRGNTGLGDRAIPVFTMQNRG